MNSLLLLLIAMLVAMTQQHLFSDEKDLHHERRGRRPRTRRPGSRPWGQIGNNGLGAASGALGLYNTIRGN